MAKIDFISREPHFLDHLAPTWRALPLEARGDFYLRPTLMSRAEQYGIKGKTLADLEESDSQRLVLASSYGDLKFARNQGRKIILSEHGAGQSYQGVENGSYIGAPDRAGVVAVLTPGQKQAKRQLDTHPTIPVYPVGVPKLDRWHLNPKPANPKTIAISFHWDCRIAPETRSAFRYFRRALGKVAEQFEVIGHGHPRDWGLYKGFWTDIGVEPVKDFDQVIERAGIYVCDNSSTLYEWASLDRPVVLLNAPVYRRDVEHGMRFWEHSDLGISVDRPERLIEAITKAQEDPSEVARRRLEIVQEIYCTTAGNAAEKAAEAVIEIARNWPQYQ